MKKEKFIFLILLVMGTNAYCQNKSTEQVTTTSTKVLKKMPSGTDPSNKAPSAPGAENFRQNMSSNADQSQIEQENNDSNSTDRKIAPPAQSVNPTPKKNIK